jgi:hypothetical protein
MLMQAARDDLDRMTRTLHVYAKGRGRALAWERMRTDLAAQWRALPGVLYVEELSLGEDGMGQEERCGFISVCRHALVAPGRHQITIANGGTCDE